MPDTARTARKSTSEPGPGAAVRDSWATLDALVQRAFAPPAPIASPTMTPTPSMRRLEVPAQAQERPLSMNLEPPEPTGETMDPVWQEVRLMKARMLAALPSKVKSLEGVTLDQAPSCGCKCKEDGEGTVKPLKSERAQEEKPKPPQKLRRKISANFKESPDRRTFSATFDLTGVRKQDMHVAFKTNRVVVTWRRIKTVEKMENGTLVRERREKQYSQTIPLPEGVQWNEIKASRESNGNRLVLTFPALRCVRAESHPHPPSTTLWSSGATDFQTALTTVEAYEDIDIERE